MKAFFALSIYAILFLSSCGGNDESAFAIKQKIAAADRAIVNYANGKTVELGSAKGQQLSILKDAFQDENANDPECIEDGSIVFFRGEIMIENAGFSLKPDCRYIRFLHKNEPRRKVISENVLKLLQEMQVE